MQLMRKLARSSATAIPAAGLALTLGLGDAFWRQRR